LKGHETLAAALSDLGVSTMFGLMGDGNMYFVDSFVQRGGRYVAVANEAASVLMASGYAWASGEVGVATVTHGPGLANTLASLVSGARDRVPLLLLTGDTAYNGREQGQKIDQAALVLPTGAGFEAMTSANSGPAVVARAFHRALVERRPIVVNVPVDFNFEEVEYLAPTMVNVAGVPSIPGDDAMDVAVGIMASARRPIVLAGIGAIDGDAPQALTELAQTLGAPLLTTLAAKGLFGPDKYDLGVCGTLSSPPAVDAIMASDCIIAVGASLNEFTGGGAGWPYFRGKHVVHCDADPSALATQYLADAPVLADATLFARTSIDWLKRAGYASSGFRETITLGSGEGIAKASSGEFVELIDALVELNRVLPVERAITVDGGRFAWESIKRLEVPRARCWAGTFRGFGAVGNALSTAIGVGMALSGLPSVAVVGDGGFMIGGLAEFNTAVRYGVDLIVFVCNDGTYGAEYGKLVAHGFAPESSYVDWPDFAPVAQSLGGSGFTIRNATDLAGLASVIADRDRPLLIDLKLDRTASPKEY